MHAGSFVLFYTINDSDKVGDLKKKMYMMKLILIFFVLTLIVLVNKSFISLIKVQTP